MLSDIEPVLVQASHGKRLANFLVDIAGFYIVAFIVLVIVAIINPGAFEHIDRSFQLSFINQMAIQCAYGFYTGLVEGLFRGKSLGKLITGTRAVTEDGRPATMRVTLLRGLIRAVPFEPFSALGTPSFPFHDRWSNTLVIDEKASMLPNA